MFDNLINDFKISIKFLLFCLILFGLIYPSIVTIIAQSFFPTKANGSLIISNQQIIGSRLIGQNFQQNKYFWGRPSATTPYPYNAGNSSGSNLGPLNPALLDLIKLRANNLRINDPAHQLLIPADLVMASASGLDPEISPLAAYYQIPRIAKARNLSNDLIKNLIIQTIQPRSFFIFGEPRVNVLQLNFNLDQLMIERKNNAK